MALLLQRPGAIITRNDIFRVASLFLYLAMAINVALAGNLAQLLNDNALLIASGLLALLFLVALGRYIWPEVVTYGNGRILFELGVVTAVIAVYALRGPTSALPTPWLIGVAGIFPLALDGAAALGAIAALALAGVVINRQLDAPATSWLALLYPTLFAGLLAQLLSNALNVKRLAMQQATLNDRRFDALARATRHIFLIFDRELHLKYVNHALHDVIGYTEEEIRHSDFHFEVHPDDQASHESQLHTLRSNPGTMMLSVHRSRHKEGHWVWLETRGYNMLDDEVIDGLVFSVEDITARRNAEDKLEEEHALLRAVLDLNPSMIYAKDTEGRFTISNLAFQRRFGYTSEAALRGRTAYEVFLLHATEQERNAAYDKADELHRQDLQVIKSGEAMEDLEVQGIWETDSRSWYRTNKYPLADAQQRINGVLAITRDVTDRKEYEMRLEHQALHDPLTGLPNRRYLLKTIGEGIVDFHARQVKLAMLFCDLDFFKSVNDTHGHDFGDKCLLEMTRRITTELPAADFVARFGGNEFVVLSNASMLQANTKAQGLLRVIAQPLIVDDVVVKIQASIGIALLTAEHKTASDLLRDADAAMYQAKERGRNRAEIFDASLQTSRTKRAQMDVALRFALERNELSVVYQPKVSMQTGAVTGFELLLRWHSPEYGRISPVEFIPIAENSGQIVPIGLWVLEQACLQLRDWQARYPNHAGLTMAVNVSMRQLLQSSFLTDVTDVLKRTRIAPQSIELELTETSAMANPVQTIENLSQLKKLGLRLALDDFGTGYSSLAYLQKLPIDVLKIDRAFVFGLCNNASDTEIVRLILALAQTMHLETVAEGVETSAQMQELKSMGCFNAQGYLFLPPVSADEADELLASGRTFPTE